MTATASRILTAEELIQLRVKTDRTLPIKGTKEFQPTNSWLEKKQIQTALDERKLLLEEERVERLGALAKAEWDPESRIAIVTSRVGRQWKHMGHEVKGNLHLLPEEALFLLETNGLELLHNGVAMSIQQGYSTLLGPDTGCSFNEYQTYMHLVRQGFSLLRHSKSIRATRYERQIRLDQYTVGQKPCKMKENITVQEVVIEDCNADTLENNGIINSSLKSGKIQNSVKAEDQEIIDVETIEVVDMGDESIPSISHAKEENKNSTAKRSRKLKSIESVKSRNSSVVSSSPDKSCDALKTEAVGMNIDVCNETEDTHINDVLEHVTDKNADSNANSDEISCTESTEKMNSAVDKQCSPLELQVKDNECVSSELIEEQITEVSAECKERTDVMETNTSIIEVDVTEVSAECKERTDVVMETNTSNIEEVDVTEVSAECKERTDVAMETNTSNIEEVDVTEVSAECKERTDVIMETNTSNIEEVDVTQVSAECKQRTDVVETNTSNIEVDVTEVSAECKERTDVIMETNTSNIEEVVVNQQDVQSCESSSKNNMSEAGTETVNICDTINLKSVKCVESSEDIIIVDDNSTSADDSHIEKLKDYTDKEQSKKYESECEKSREKAVSDETLTIQPEDRISDGDVVDVSDSSQTSHSEINVESSGNKSSGVETRTLLDNGDDIEIVEIKENEISIPSTSSGRTSLLHSRRRKFYEKCEDRAVKNEVQYTNAVNSYIVDVESENIGRKKITSIQLQNDEVKITPNIIDISEEVKQGPSSWAVDEVNSACSDIEVVDLEEDDFNKSELPWEEERMRILDSIPSIEGKFVIHVKVPNKNLLPPNVCPQKEDYYIQRWRLNAPGIGGKLQNEFSNYRNDSWQRDQNMQNYGQINPWIQFPANNIGGGGNMYGATGAWHNNNFAMSSPFMNLPFPGAYQLQNMFQQAAAMLSYIGNPAWMNNRLYGMPPGSSFSHYSRTTHRQRPYYYHTRPYRRPYFRRKRRFEPRYSGTPTGNGGDYGYQVNYDNEIETSRMEIDVAEQGMRLAIKDDTCVKNDDDDDDDVIECTSSSTSFPIKVDTDPKLGTSGEGQRHTSNQNGIERFTARKHRKRRGTSVRRYFAPPKKLREYMDKLVSETKEDIGRRTKVFKNDVETIESQQEDDLTADVKNWRDLKTICPLVVLDSSSEDEDDVYVIVDDMNGPEMGINEPLVQPDDCTDTDAIMRKLQIIKSVNFEHGRQFVTNERLKISFDLYLPSATFRKSSPGLPNFRISVVGYEDPIPEPREVVALLKDFQDDVPLLFAIVLPDTVTFLQFGSINLPTQKFSS